MTNDFKNSAAGFIEVTRLTKDGQPCRQLVNINVIHSVHEQGSSAFIEFIQSKDPRGGYGVEVVESYQEIAHAILLATAGE